MGNLFVNHFVDTQFDLSCHRAIHVGGAGVTPATWRADQLVEPLHLIVPAKNDCILFYRGYNCILFVDISI